MELKIGNIVKIISESKHESINKKDDVGILFNIHEGDEFGLNYRVYVVGRKFNGTPNVSNWHKKCELEVIK